MSTAVIRIDNHPYEIFIISYDLKIKTFMFFYMNKMDVVNVLECRADGAECQEDSSERVNSTKPQQARGGRSDRAEEVVTPRCYSPLLDPPSSTK